MWGGGTARTANLCFFNSRGSRPLGCWCSSREPTFCAGGKDRLDCLHSGGACARILADGPAGLDCHLQRHPHAPEPPHSGEWRVNKEAAPRTPRLAATSEKTTPSQVEERGLCFQVYKRLQGCPVTLDDLGFVRLSSPGASSLVSTRLRCAFELRLVGKLSCFSGTCFLKNWRASERC